MNAHAEALAAILVRLNEIRRELAAIEKRVKAGTFTRTDLEELKTEHKNRRRNIDFPRKRRES